MTIRTSNDLFLGVRASAPLEQTGWYARVLSERDYATTIAEVQRFTGLGLTIEANAEGGGSISLDADDRIWTDPLPSGEVTRLADQEALWQVFEDGQLRTEFLAEDLEQDVIPSGGGPRQTKITGRGTAAVLEWARVLPAGMPTPTTLDRAFTAKPMAAWLTLLTESKAAGFITWVTASFTAAADSRGVPWAGANQALTVKAGDDLLSILKRWCEANDYAWRMLPGFVLEVTQQRGTDRSGTVVFTSYRQQDEHQRSSTRRDIANVVYAESGNKGVTIASDSSSQTKWRKRMAWVSAGDAADTTSRAAIANTSLALAKDQQTSRSIKVPAAEPGRRPFVDFDLHDWVTIEVPDDDAESGAVRVLGISLDIDDDGNPAVELTLQSRREARAVKLKRTLDKLGGSTSGGAGGAAASPISVSSTISSTTVSSLADVDVAGIAAGDILQWNGARFVDATPTLDFLADVDAAPPATGTVGLTYDRDTSRWKATTQAGMTGWQELPLFLDATTTTAAALVGGAWCRWLLDATVTGLSAKLDTTAGTTYRFGIYRTTQARAVVEVIGTWDVTASATATGTTLTTGPITAALDAGQMYALTVGPTSGGNPTRYQAAAPAQLSGPFAALPATGPGVAQTGHPGVGTTLTTSTNPAAVGFTARAR